MQTSEAPLQAGPGSRVNTLSGIPVREDVAFTDSEGQEKEKIRDRVTYALEQLQEPLRKILQPQEAVLYVVRAQSPMTFFFQYTTGWMAYQLSACVLVLTTRRLIEFRVNPSGLTGSNWKWRSSWRSVQWGDLREAQVKGILSGELRLAYGDGKKEKFWRMQRQDKKKLQTLVPELLRSNAGQISAAGTMVAHCPQCAAALTAGNYQCAACGQRFKDERTATMRSILIPGGGYFYSDLWQLGILDAIGEGFLTIVFLLLLFGAASGPKPGEEPVTWELVIFILILLAVEKSITVYHAKHRVREFIPIKA